MFQIFSAINEYPRINVLFCIVILLCVYVCVCVLLLFYLNKHAWDALPTPMSAN